MKTKNVIGIAIIILSSVISSGCKTGLQAGCEDGFINFNNAGCVPDPTGQGAVPPSETPSPEGGSSLAGSDTFTDPNTCLVSEPPVPSPEPTLASQSCFDKVAKKIPQNFDMNLLINFDALDRLAIDTGNEETNKSLEDMIHRFKESISAALTPLYVGSIRSIAVSVDGMNSPEGVQNPYALSVEFKEDALDEMVLENLVPGSLSVFDFFTKKPDGKTDEGSLPMETTLVSHEGNKLVIHMQKSDGSAASDMECYAEKRFFTCYSATSAVEEADSFFSHEIYSKSFAGDVEPNCPQMHVFVPHSTPKQGTKEDSGINIPYDMEVKVNMFTDPAENIKLLQIKILGWVVEQDAYKWVLRNTTDLNMDVADMIPSFITWLTASSENTVNEQDYCGFLDTCAQMESPCACDTSYIPLANQNCPAKALDISQCALPPK